MTAAHPLTVVAEMNPGDLAVGPDLVAAGAFDFPAATGVTPNFVAPNSQGSSR